MTTRARIRKQFDFGRLREALAGPRADTRSWVELGRVDDDPDAVQFIPGYGWVADVTFVSGDIAGSGPCPCRVLSAFGASGEATICPVALGAEVAVLVTSGDANVQPVIVGFLHNPTVPIPVSVNGTPLDESYAAANVTVATAAGFNAQLGPTVRVSATTKASLEAPAIALADENAVQPFVRGTDLQSALNNLANALAAPGAFVSILPAANPITVSLTLGGAITSFTTALAAALSTRIKGE